MHIAPIALLGLVAIPLLLLWIAALVSILRHEHTPLVVLWVIGTFFFPVMGPIAWFLIGRGVAESRVPLAG
jgi:hypothetical protein